jgi:hypothetical protein
MTARHNIEPADGHLLLYTLSHIEPSGNAPVRSGYNELTLQLATAAWHVQRPNLINGHDWSEKDRKKRKKKCELRLSLHE